MFVPPPIPVVELKQTPTPINSNETIMNSLMSECNSIIIYYYYYYYYYYIIIIAIIL